jgi:hypothetical protein
MSTRNRKLRMLTVIGSVTVVLALVVWGTLFTLQRRAVRKASALLRQLTDIRVGQTTSEELTQAVQGLARYDRYPQSSICPDADAIYSTSVDSSPVYKLADRFHSLQELGFHPWSAIATIWVARDKVCGFRYSFSVTRSSDAKEISVSIEAHPSSIAASASFIPVIDSRRSLEFTTLLYPEANRLERYKAFDLDFKCAESVRGCSSPCTIIRSAWPDFELEVRRSASHSPAIAIDEFHCN